MQVGNFNQIPAGNLQREPQPETEVNVWRDTPVRYLGYADEYGEALSPYLGHAVVRATYVLSSLYALCDVFTTARKTRKADSGLTHDQRKRNVLVGVGDGLLFHTAATVFMPALVIRNVRILIEKLLEHPKAPAKLVKRKAPFCSLVGLALIPILSHPVDNLINKVLDWTYRRATAKLLTPVPVASPQPAGQFSQRIQAPITFQHLFNYQRSS